MAQGWKSLLFSRTSTVLTTLGPLREVRPKDRLQDCQQEGGLGFRVQGLGFRGIRRVLQGHKGVAEVYIGIV